MHDHSFFIDIALVFLVAITGGMLAWRLRLPLIVGYVSGGLLLSRFTPGPYISNTKNFEFLAEIGVILLMFSIGAEFSVKDLLRVKWIALVGGPIGVALSVLMGISVGHFLGYTALQGAIIGSIISVASTMVLVRMLVDRGELQTRHGSVMVAITLVEDLVVVALTVIIPSLRGASAEQYVVIGWNLGKAVLFLVPIWVLGAKVIPGLMRRVAQTHTEELFLLLSLALCLGVAALVQATGLSLALGAFLAGMIISSSDYGHESLAQLLPMRDAFVALFFVTIGALVDPNVVVTHWRLLLALILMIVLGKFVIWTLVVILFRESLQTAMLVAIGLTQIGEFSFILVQVARDAGHLGSEVYSATLGAALISILINALLFRFAPDLVNRSRFDEVLEPVAVEVTEKHVLICGHGRLGGPVAAALETFGYPYTVLEVDPDIVSDLHKRGVNVIFGDPVRKRVLESAGVARASLAIVTIPDKNRSWRAVKNIRQLNQEMPIIVRIQRQNDRDALIDAGATYVIQPESEASVAMIRLALEYLNVGPESYDLYIKSLRQAGPEQAKQA